MKVGERECLDEVKKDGKEKRQRKGVNSNEEMPHGMGGKFLQPAVRLRAIPHNSKCRYGEQGAADAKPKAQIILDVLSSILATQMPCRSCRSGA